MLVRVLRQCEVQTGPQSWAVRALFDGQQYELPDDQAEAVIAAGDAVAVGTAPAGASADPSVPPPHEPAGAPSASGAELSTLTVAQLKARAAEAGIELPGSAKKADIVAIIAAQGEAQGVEDSSGEE